MDNKTPKLRAVAVREIRLTPPTLSRHDRAVAALSSLSQTLETSVDQLQKQADLLHVEAVLVSEGINDNDDAFTREELKRAISSPILKPMNWQHKDDEILGTMYAVEARDMEGKSLAAEEIDDQPIELVVQGVVWHHLPHIKVTASEIVQRIEQGDLFVSMECWFDNYDYALYKASGELYDHIERNRETAFLDGYLRANGGNGFYNGMRIGRALSGVAFGGVAFVDRPANKRSFILNHFAFDPTESFSEAEANNGVVEDQTVTQTTLLSNDRPTEVNMNDLNRAAASADQIAEGVEKVMAARDAREAANRTKAELDTAVARVAELESKLVQASNALDTLQAAIDSAYAGATSDTPEEIAKIDRALEVKDGAGDAVFAAKIAWIADSRKAVANALVENTNASTDEKLVEENVALKAELDGIKTDLRQREIEYLFAHVLEMTEDEVKTFVTAGLAKATDDEYKEWLEEKKIFAKKMLEMKGKDYKGKDKKKEDAKAEDAEAGLLSPSQRETSIDDHGAVLRGLHGRVPSDVARTPRSKLSASANIEDMFEEAGDEPNLAGASADEASDSGSPMGRLVAGLLPGKNKNKEVS